MGRMSLVPLRWSWSALLALSACSGTIGDGTPPVGASPSPSPSVSMSPSPSPTTPGVPVVTPLPSGIERLSTRQVALAIEALLPGQTIDVSGLPPDTRQSDFTKNRDQIVDPSFAKGLAELAEAAAAEAVRSHRTTLAPCAGNAAPTESCANTVLARLGAAAFRRPLSDQEKTGLTAVFRVGLTERDGWYGLQLGVEALLQSPSFLYAVAIGSADGADRSKLDDREAAETLALLLTGRPADAELIRAADAHALADPAERERQARRLYALPAAREHLARALLEWLRIDRINEIAKDGNAFPEFFGLRPDMWREALSFASAASGPDVDTLHQLLSAPPAPVSQGLTALYGSAPRKGILTQAAFLSVLASPTETSPVRRGNAILKKLLCVDLPLPTGLMVNIVPPAPDPTQTTRERFSRHSQDAACSNCHRQIDPLGFAFEGFDAIGRPRTMENNKPIDTVVRVTSVGAEGEYSGAIALIDQLAVSAEVRACFARNIYRFALGTPAKSLEDSLVEDWKTRGQASGRLGDVLAIYASSPWFMIRGAQP